MTMKASDRCIDFILDFEKLKLVSYPDVKGVWTIGYGHTGADVGPHMKITESEARIFFKQDLAWAEHYVNTRLKSPTTQAQFDAMVSLVYNIGSGGFRTSTVLRLHNTNWDFGACAAFLMWHKSGGKRIRGLLRRRCQEAAMYCSEDWGQTDG